MNRSEFTALASRLMRHPAAPYHEHAVAQELKSICAEYRLDCEEDKFGNLLVQLAENKNSRVAHTRPIVFAAHMDHPGFELIGKAWPPRVQFLGGVPDEYFRPGLPLLLMPGATRARLGKRIGKDRVFTVQSVSRSRPPPTFAVWDLEHFAIRQQRIHGRACDDLIGVASALAAVIDLSKLARKQRGRARAAHMFHPMAAISRAEEVGFRGALTLCRSKLIPNDALIVSLETSRELPGVKMGKGVILRVGDRTSIFNSDAMRFLNEVAADCKKSGKGFNYQRALMSGGTCEATAYQEYGFQTAAVCVALGNYHNCAPGKRIAAEYISIADALSMVDLLVDAAKQMRHFDQITRRLPLRLEKMRKQAAARLTATKTLKSNGRHRS